MRKTYQVLANAIAVLVIVQAGAIAWAFFGLTRAIDQDGLVVNKSCLQEDSPCAGFAGEFGFALHFGIVGSMLIPLLTLLVLVVSFFAKVRGGVAMAVGLVVVVVLQIVVLPLLSGSVSPVFGALHGINAFVLMGLAVMAGRRAGSAPVETGASTSPATA